MKNNKRSKKTKDMNLFKEEKKEMKVILIYKLDNDIKVEYFESISDMESTYNCVKKSFGKRFRLEFAGSVRNEFEFKTISKDWEEVLI